MLLKPLSLALGMFGLFVFLAVAGLIYEKQANKQDLKLYTPPGQLFEVNGRKLHLHCVGEGSPTVVMDYGLGGLSTLWGLIQPEIAKFTQVCTYDRAGYGWSEETDCPRTSQQMVEELRSLLKVADMSPPYLLVGHSLGGLNMRLFASQHPEEVIGLILVDAVPTNVYSRLSPQFAESMESTRKLFQNLSLISEFGLLRLGMQWGGKSVIPEFIQQLPSELQPMTLAQFIPKTFRTAIAESYNLEVSAEQVNQVPFPADFPLIVLSHGKNMFSGSDAEKSKAIWQQLQKETSELSRQGKLEIAHQSGHNIHLDQPELLLEAMKQIITKFRLNSLGS